MKDKNTQENIGNEGEESLDFGVEMPQMTQIPPLSNENDWIEKNLAVIRVRRFIHSEAVGEERQERESTTRMKNRFLEVYAKTMGTITLACDQADIERKTFYRWMQTDPEFRSKVNKQNDDRVDMVEDRLLKLIQMDDGPSIRFFLQAKNPEYKSKSQVEVVKGDRTFEDILYEMAEEELALEKGETKKESHDEIQ